MKELFTFDFIIKDADEGTIATMLLGSVYVILGIAIFFLMMIFVFNGIDSMYMWFIRLLMVTIPTILVLAKIRYKEK